jgi:uncharacterized membrane protein (DUF106 family)
MERNKINPTFILACITAFILSSCGSDSSPEGRMSTKLENLQKEMLESQKQQNAAILDSLSKIREEITQLQQTIK